MRVSWSLLTCLVNKSGRSCFWFYEPWMKFFYYYHHYYLFAKNSKFKISNGNVCPQLFQLYNGSNLKRPLFTTHEALLFPRESEGAYAVLLALLSFVFSSFFQTLSELYKRDLDQFTLKKHKASSSILRSEFEYDAKE